MTALQKMIEGIELNENNIQDYPAELIQSMLQRRNGTLLNLDKIVLFNCVLFIFSIWDHVMNKSI